ncbi:DNA polymerase thumb domain-containing protein [Gottfriedia acidiceleris]|uniref:DNA repair protein n=1 Tax=Gottfriedia acidiceleris TaxID=371036 RepID=A0ABY4JQR8_9BACI|nr:DNA repair protein [Gottfriedia acidiceleris]UPM56144.1 DNA repair protein [Gottfriedia acidiceleris]
MYDYSMFPNDIIFFIDMKSFFASVSCRLLGLDPLKVKLAVVGDTSREGSVVLAATPEMKKLGIATGNRLYEIPRQKDIHIVNPSMATYVKISNQIAELLLTKYVAPIDYMQYSIDEMALQLNGYDRIHKMPPLELAYTIQQDILNTFGIFSSIGISCNLLLAKICMDIESKKVPSGIAQWTYDDVQTKMWKIEPLSKFWGIAKKTEEKLNRLGITTIGELARFPKKILIQRFGNVMGTELHLHANGIDYSRIAEMKNFKPADKSIGKSQVLLRDYKSHEIPVLILEQLEEVCYRLRSLKNLCRTIHFGIGYSQGGGFSQSMTIDRPTDLTKEWYQVCLKILNQNYTNEAVRTISISLKNFVSTEYEQLSLFTNENNRLKDKKLTAAMDGIRRKYGKNSILRAVSYLDYSTIRHNNKKIGGHLA